MHRAEPEALEVNAIVCPAANEDKAGVNEIAPVVGVVGVVGVGDACKVMEALAVLLGEVTLAAVSVTMVCVLTVAGAVYKPFAIVPMLGVSDQETDAAPPPTSEGVNCADCPGASVVEAGLSWIAVDATPVVEPPPAGTRETTAVALIVVSCRLVAVSVTVCAALIALGAV